MSIASETPSEHHVPTVRVSGKSWKQQKTPIRARALGVSKQSWEEKVRKRNELAAVKAKERELKEEKENARKELVQKIKDRREAKAEKERLEVLQKVMHRKKIDRMRKREKRNKLLKER